jgi:hypothetical protein
VAGEIALPIDEGDVVCSRYAAFVLAWLRPRPW